jgi:hypothetical protein
MTRWPRTLLTVACTLIGVCLLIVVARPARDEPAHREPTKPGRVVNETPVLADLATWAPAPWGWRVLDTPADHAAYSGWLVKTEPDLAARVRSLRSDGTHVHLAGHQSVGCGGVSGPLLRRTGTTYVLDFASRPKKQHVACAVAYDAVVVFRIPRADARTAFGSGPHAAGPGTLAAHFALSGYGPSTVRAMEITHRVDRDRLLATLATDGETHDRTALAADIETALAEGPGRAGGARAFAFPVGSCVGATPTLDITPSALRAEVSPECAAPVPSLVVFVVPARVVPDGATLG